MIFDDHDVHDDWNISESWLEEMRATDWWGEHCIGALTSYWVYQHLGNLTPELIRENPILAKLKEEDDGEEMLREFVRGGDREHEGSRWSYCRDVGGTRLIVIDSRAGRVLDEGKREMVDAAEWDWITEHTEGDFDHLLLATSLPYLLGPGMQYVEAWNEAVTWRRLGRAHVKGGREAAPGDGPGALGRVPGHLPQDGRAAACRRSRRARARRRARSSRSRATSTTPTSSRSPTRRASEVESAIWQAVCSPYPQPARRQASAASSRWACRVHSRAVWKKLAKLAGVKDPGIRWRLSGGGPWFDNQVATLVIDGRRMDMHLDKAVPVDEETARLERVLDARLA